MKFEMRKQKRLVCAVLTSAFLLSGCGAHFNSIYRQNELGSKEVLISQDAKQRVVSRLKHPHSSKLVTCVEPSPDVFSVLAAAASGTFSSPEGVAAAISGASSETGASIGLRTQSIQLLRDQSYRICESYANGALDELDYAQLVRRNQVMLTAVLAIEQLTGAVVGPSAAIGASSSVEIDKEAVQNASNKVGEIEKQVGTQQGVVDAKQAEIDKQTEVIAAKQTAVSTQEVEVANKQAAVTAAEEELKKFPDPASQEHKDAQKVFETANAELQAATEKLTGLNGELTMAQTTLNGLNDQLTKEKGSLKGLKDQQTVAQQNLNAVRAPNVTTQTASTLQPAQVVSKDIPAVASAVQNIVRMALEKQYLIDFCQMYWGGVKSMEKAKSTVLATKCDQVLTEWFKASTKAADAVAKNVPGDGQGLEFPNHLFSVPFPGDVENFVR